MRKKKSIKHAKWHKPEGKSNEIKRAHLSASKGESGDYILISRLVDDLIKIYLKGSKTSLMLAIAREAEMLLADIDKQTSRISIPGSSIKLILNRKNYWAPTHNSSRLVTVEVDESFVGYRIDNFKNIIVDNAVHDLLSENSTKEQT